MNLYISRITVHISSFLRRGHCRTASLRIFKREIRIDDTADLASGRKSSKNNDEDVRGTDLRVRKDFEIMPWEGHRGKRPPRFISLFVNVIWVCVKGIYLKGRMRGWRQQRITSCHPEKPSRQCRLL